MEKFPWWTPDISKFADEVTEFVDTRLRPLAEKMTAEQLDEINWEACRLLAEHKLTPLHVITNAEDGGRDKGFTGLAILLEEISRSYLNVTPLMTALFVGYPIYLFGTKRQKETYLYPLMKMEKTAAFCVTEPDVGSDVASIQTRLRREGDGYILNGWKRFITLGEIADFYLVCCLSDPSSEAKRLYRHLSAVLVPRDTKGITTEKVNRLAGQTQMHNAVIRFKDVIIPQEDLILDEGSGWLVMNAALNIERVTLSSLIGQGRVLLESTKAYAKRRVQFGAPIAEYQLIQKEIADMVIKLRTARLLTYYLTYLLDSGTVDLLAWGVDASIAKIYITEALWEMANAAMLVHGGDGYTRDYPIESIWKNVMLARLAGGTNDILRLFIARTELRKPAETKLLRDIYL
jgi:alkylation response protein AidB-like acyl-CoA dehydrogenase